MYLDEQIQSLIDEAPQYGVPEVVMAKAVTPTLKSFASQLQHSRYYVLHDQNRSWLVTTLSNRKNPQEEKRVIYAFSTRKDAVTSQGTTHADLRIVSIPVIHLLFQLFAVESIDSLIFQEVSGHQDEQKEIQRAKLQNMIQQQLRRLTAKTPDPIPPNLA